MKGIVLAVLIAVVGACNSGADSSDVDQDMTTNTDTGSTPGGITSVNDSTALPDTGNVGTRRGTADTPRQTY